MIGIHAELMASGDQLVLVAGGPEHEVAAAARALQLLTPAFTTSKPPGALLGPATWPTVVQLSATFGPAWVPGPRLQEWIAAETAARLQPLGDSLSFATPEGLVPRDYQIAGALEIARTGRAMIFDEPRTGKTITTILGIREHAWRTDTRCGPVLVVCPASVVDPWVEAWQAWSPGLRAVAWRGPKRRALAGTADVYVTSYETARVDTPSSTVTRAKARNPLLALDADYLVVDECHLIKNPAAERTKAVGRLAKRVRGFVALSGTPITHNPADMIPTLDALAPGTVPSRERWINRYCAVAPDDYEETILGLSPFTEPEFRLSIVGQHRRVARADVMAQLPPKVYSVRTVDMPAEWRKVYDDFEKTMLAELPDGTELSVMDMQTKYNHLTRLASAPADVEVTYGPDLDQFDNPKRHVKLDLKAPSWKVDALLQILDERPGESTVVFAPSRQLVMLAGAALEKAGYRVGYVVGGQSQGERTAARNAFQAGELDVICATTGAGGTGITLSRAGTLVFLQRPWALVESIQAEDRGEGDMNATRGTEVIDIVARNTIDTRVRAVLRERGGALADFVQDPRIAAELLGGAHTERKSA